MVIIPIILNNWREISISDSVFHEEMRRAETMRSVSGFPPRTREQPDDKSQYRKNKNEYDPENLGARGDAALKNIDYRPNVSYQYQQSEKTTKSEHGNLLKQHIESFCKSQQSEKCGSRDVYDQFYRFYSFD